MLPKPVLFQRISRFLFSVLLVLMGVYNTPYRWVSGDMPTGELRGIFLAIRINYAW